MTAQSNHGWRRFTTYGLMAYLALDVTIATLAYQGSLWAYLPGIPNFDFAGHFFLIGGLAFFLDGALGYRPVTRRLPWMRLAPVVVLTAAGIEELAQALTPRRTSSVSDFVADVLGVAFFSWLSGRLARRFGQHLLEETAVEEKEVGFTTEARRHRGRRCCWKKS